jgi:hypothetical protein
MSPNDYMNMSQLEESYMPELIINIGSSIVS